jgi:hypothetical protein
MTHQITRFLTAGFLLLSLVSYSQSVGIGTETPNSNAILELVAPNNNQGLLVPRMTTAQRTANSFTENLSATDNGLMVYDQDENKFFFWIIDQWVELSSGNLSGLPDQAGQSGKFLTTDGLSSSWGDPDFNTLINIPSDLADGDDDTQLSDSDIEALGYIKDADDADADPTNEDQTVSAGTGISVNQVGDDFEVTNTSPDQTVTITDAGNGNVDIAGTYPNFTLDVIDIPAVDIAVSPTVDLLSSDVQAALEELQGEITAAASAAIPDGAVTTPKLGNLAVTNAKINDVDFSKLNAVPADLADGDDVDDADADPLNEVNTGMSLSGTTIQVTDANSTQGVDIGGTFATDAELAASDAADGDMDDTNEIQDISTDGSAGDISLSDGSSLTLNVNDADASTTNEVNTGMSLSGTTIQVTDANSTQGVDIGGTFATDAELAASDAVDGDMDDTNEIQDISTSGIAGNITLSSGSTINLNVNDADASTTNEVNTGMSLSGTTVQVTDANSTQGVDIGGTFATDAELAASDLADGDKDDTNEIELPTQTGQNGNFLTTNGTAPSWSSISESQWTTNGTSINYITGNVNIGSGTIPTSRLQLTTNNSASTTPQLTLNEQNGTSDAAVNLNSGGVNYTLGVDGSVDYFKISGSTSLGTNDWLTIDNLGTMGIGVTPNAQFHVQTNSIESTNTRLTNTHSSSGSKIGILNEVDNQGTSIKTGLWNDIEGTSGNTSTLRGVFNEINPTDGIAYGVWTQILSAGSGVRYGSYNDVRSAPGNAGNIYGFRAQMDNDGNGDSFGFQANMLGTTSGRKYGIYTNGENYNYFEGNVGIGEIEPDVELYIERFTLSSTLPMVRLSSPHDAAISYELSGGVDFITGIDATDNFYKVSAGSSLGLNNRMTIDLTGNLGINQPAPSARLDVVGTTELNGTVDINSTLDVQDQLTVTNDIEISETNNYTYAGLGQTRYLSIHPMEFKVINAGSVAENLITPSAVDLYVYFDGGAGAQGNASVPLRLPNGASIDGLEAWVLDNTASQLTRVRISRHSVGTSNSRETIAVVETTVAGTNASVTQLSTASTFNRIVDNQNYSYSVRFTGLDNSNLTQLHGVRITYSVLQAD